MQDMGKCPSVDGALPLAHDQKADSLHSLNDLSEATTVGETETTKEVFRAEIVRERQTAFVFNDVIQNLLDAGSVVGHAHRDEAHHHGSIGALRIAR